MRRVEYVVLAIKGDRIVKTFERFDDLARWLEKREKETQYVPVRIVRREILEETIELRAAA